MTRLKIIGSFLLIAFSCSSQASDGLITVNEGKIYYELTGNGPPIVFLHGLALDHRMWQQQVEYFSDSFTCIAVDLRGFGKSSTPTNAPYGFHEDIKTVLDSLHITEPVVLIGFSMGGRAAANFALAYPSRTKALILSDAVVDGYVFKQFSLQPFMATAAKYGVDKANELFFNDTLFATARRDSNVYSRMHEMILSYSGWNWVHKNPVLGLTPPAMQQLEKLKMPVLIITGEYDTADFRQIGDELHKGIKQSVKKEIAGAGHMCNMEKPKVYNATVRAFLNSAG
jgi:3-oxoadipate enol-lactonase